MSIENFMLNRVEHEKSFITSGPVLFKVHATSLYHPLVGQMDLSATKMEVIITELVEFGLRHTSIETLFQYKH